jgi:FHS family L-fucose permease-like MFS transporter
MTRNNFLLPFALVTSLFFLWGLSYGLLDVLNKHFQEVLQITRRKSTLLQFAYFGAYFVAALPAGLFMKRFGYKRGILLGLFLFAAGALLCYPAAEAASFPLFLFSFFVLASGLTFLETAANPYVTVLGEPETSAFRINLAQSFNGVGTIVGPLIGGALFFGSGQGGQLGSVQMVYIGIAAAVLVVAFLIFRTPLPEIREEELLTDAEGHEGRSLFRHRHFTGAIAAQFFYVAAQVGIAALFINYCTEKKMENPISNEKAAYLFSVAQILFTVGRFTGTALLRRTAPQRLLSLYAAVNILLCLVVVLMPGMISIYALMAILFFESIMFPTIFALGVRNLGRYTKRGGSFIIMSISGGAIMPFVMGWMADRYSTQASYIIPLLCFLVVLWYGARGYKTHSEHETILPDGRSQG